MFRKIFYTLSAFVLVTVPAYTHAAISLTVGSTPAEVLVLNLGRVVNVATPVLAGIALLAFFWGLARFIFHGGDEEKRSEGKKMMGWSIIAIFVIFSIWGIVFFIAQSVGVGVGGSVPTPCVVGVPGCTFLGNFGGLSF